tara:strand:- start:111 stop:662 length:552 start_codon:yes stop_codon:yes gene_type:complete
MEQLITGCERSGTKMLSQKLGKQLNIDFNLENKHTISCFKYYQELQRWNKYRNDSTPVKYVTRFEKHTLNDEINIDFLKWVKQTWPHVKIYYIIRDGRSVVSSITNKVWGHSQTTSNYNIDFYTACKQWQEVINNTWDWAQENCEIIRYEDICDVISTPLTKEQYKESTLLLHKNLLKTGYKA